MLGVKRVRCECARRAALDVEKGIDDPRRLEHSIAYSIADSIADSKDAPLATWTSHAAVSCAMLCYGASRPWPTMNSTAAMQRTCGMRNERL